ncbi:MAG: hypothetical protein JXA30_17415 [Deltaproteobacteria bacterium]|nr:hypothetical protein [Deltaproteobacteria bacterium]
MQNQQIAVAAGGKRYECDTAIMIDTRALEADGHIALFSKNSGDHTKHEYYALAQTVLFQFQDGDLTPVAVEGPIALSWKDRGTTVASGIAILRTRDGEVSILSHADQPTRKLLETAYKFCTRWVRLDVR